MSGSVFQRGRIQPAETAGVFCPLPSARKTGSALARVRKTLDEWEHSDFPGPLVSGTKESCKADADRLQNFWEEYHGRSGL